ncbi:MAG TPA: glycosyltransferase family 4 protein [bacterium]|nr:glycosyltransferase family 4 protein [bacterium]HQL62099.1 glycosyltransferase family 4 protein [bacterium]
MSDVALVISDLGRGGTQRVLTNLANYWSQSGIEVTVITLQKRDRDFFQLSPSVRRIEIGGVSESKSIFSAVQSNLNQIRAIREAIRSTGAPVVVGFIGATNILVIAACIGLRIRVVISERNDPKVQSIGRIWDFLRWAFYRFADVVTANSHGAVNSLARYVPKRKLAYIPNILVIPPESEPFTFARPTILAVGCLHRQKAFDILLESFAMICAQITDWQLAFVGDGPENEALHKQARSLGIGEQVQWLGAKEDPFPYYRAAEIFALPSRYEGTPNALLEAMACGLPAVVSDGSPGLLEWVEDGISGKVVPVENAQGLANALLDLIRDPALRKQLGQAAKLRVAECTPENAVRVWEDVVGLRG